MMTTFPPSQELTLFPLFQTDVKDSLQQDSLSQGAYPTSAFTPELPIEVQVPGSKSYTIRALLLAAMTRGTVVLRNPLLSDDTQAMLACLQTLGITAWLEGNGKNASITVEGTIAEVPTGEFNLHCDLSAASLRFLLALSAVLPGIQTLQGRHGLNQRPVKDLVDSLRILGADIDYLERDGYPPVRVNSSRLNGHAVSIAGSTSSQYLSALMMLAPAIDGLTLNVTGELISRPYLDMTMAIMRDFGVQSEVGEDQRTFIVPPGQHYTVSNGEYIVEGDASGAAYPLACAALTGRTLVLRNLPPQSVQADMQFLAILEQMGHPVERRDDSILFHGTGVIRPLVVNMEDCPDQAQTLAVLLAFATGTSRLEGLRSLRVKETDRLSAVATELTKMGIQVEEEAEALVIHGGQPKAAAINTYGDHRMAMAFAVAGTRINGLRILDPAVVNKTYPTFWDECPDWGIGIRQPGETRPVESESPHAKSSSDYPGDKPGIQSISACLKSLLSLDDTVIQTLSQRKIVLIGFMGAGKTRLAGLLASVLGLPQIDTDTLVVELSGRETVADIFDLDGETRFRELEMEVARQLQVTTPAVIATGGGLVMNKLAMDYISEGAHVVYLDATLDTLLARLDRDTARPLLRDQAGVEALFGLRAPLYRHYGKLHIATDGQTPEAVALTLLRALTLGNALSTAPTPATAGR